MTAHSNRDISIHEKRMFRILDNWMAFGGTELQLPVNICLIRGYFDQRMAFRVTNRMLIEAWLYWYRGLTVLETCLVQELAVPSSDGVLWRREDPQPEEDPSLDDYLLRDPHSALPPAEIATRSAFDSANGSIGGNGSNYSNGSNGWSDVDGNWQPLPHPPRVPQLPSPWDAPEFYSSASAVVDTAASPPEDALASGARHNAAVSESEKEELFSPAPTSAAMSAPPATSAPSAIPAATAWNRGESDTSREDLYSASAMSLDTPPSSAAHSDGTGNSREELQASLVRGSSSIASSTSPPEVQFSRSDEAGREAVLRDLSDQQEDVPADEQKSGGNKAKANGGSTTGSTTGSIAGSTTAADATKRTPRREIARAALLDNVEDEEELAADSTASLAGLRARTRRWQRRSKG